MPAPPTSIKIVVQANQSHTTDRGQGPNARLKKVKVLRHKQGTLTGIELTKEKKKSVGIIEIESVIIEIIDAGSPQEGKVIDLQEAGAKIDLDISAKMSEKMTGIETAGGVEKDILTVKRGRKWRRQGRNNRKKNFSARKSLMRRESLNRLNSKRKSLSGKTVQSW